MVSLPRRRLGGSTDSGYRARERASSWAASLITLISALTFFPFNILVWINVLQLGLPSRDNYRWLR